MAPVMVLNVVVQDTPRIEYARICPPHFFKISLFTSGYWGRIFIFLFVILKPMVNLQNVVQKCLSFNKQK